MDEISMRAVAEQMVDRSGDDRWFMIEVEPLRRWFAEFDTVTEACDFAESESITPDLFLDDEV